MGVKAAMACTEAVETVIGNHYNDQIRELTEIEGGGEEMEELKKVLSKFRDDEMEHLETAVENDAKGAVGYTLLGSIIQAGCKASIEIAKRV
jgi:ubiquinone biosynthesis monooxygenase Coq7